MVVALGVWLSVVGVLRVADTHPEPLAIGAVVFVGAAVASVLRSLLGSVETVVWPVHSIGRRDRRLEDRMEITLKNQLEAARRRGSRTLDVTLIAIVDDRLESRHRIDRSQDPIAADEVLHPVLRDLVDATSPPVGTPMELRRVLDSIEVL